MIFQLNQWYCFWGVLYSSSGSITPQMMINQLYSSKSLIVNINESENSEAEAAFLMDKNKKIVGSAKEQYVFFNPTQGINLVDNLQTLTGTKISPATVLAHELAHIYNGLIRPEQEYKDVNDSENPLVKPEYDNMSEYYAITETEHDVAKFYGEGIRFNHRGKPFEAKCSTTTEQRMSESLNLNKTVELKPKG